MRRFIASGLLVIGSAAFSAQAAVPFVANGDFQTNANAFTSYPGYVGQNGNPSQVQGFSGPSGGYGVNGPDTNTTSPFTDNGGDSTDVLFIQAGNTVLTQDISGFVSGRTYQLDYDYNARACCGGTPGLLISLGSGSSNTGPITPVGGSNPYDHGSFQFTANGTQTLSITKLDAVAGDSTALLDNLVISVVPEPASISLIGLGAFGLFVRRRHA